MPSKKERKYILSQIWSTPTPYPLDFIDKGNEIVVISSKKDISDWWMSVFRSLYPKNPYLEKGDLFKMKTGVGVVMKLNCRTGVMKVTGKNHWTWFADNFTAVLEQGNADMESLAEASDTSVTRFLQLDRNFDEVSDLLDMIPEGGGIMLNDYIMRLWKSLIDDWFGCGATVYIATPRIDSERLFSLYLLLIRNKGTNCRCTLITPEKSPEGDRFKKTFSVTKRMLKKTKTGHKKLVSEVKMEWAMHSLEIRHENFSSNFIAGFKDDEAEVLTTTAHFHKSHFHINQKDSVCYNKLPTADLRHNYLLPLGVTSF